MVSLFEPDLFALYEAKRIYFSMTIIIKFLIVTVDL